MTLRERILAVYRGETPDCVPFMLDLQHWHYHRHGLPWNLLRANEKPERDWFDYHRKMKVGFYMPNLASFFSVQYGGDVEAQAVEIVRDGVPVITWHFTTPLGGIHRARVWQPDSYSWGLDGSGVRTESEMRILGCVLSRRRFVPHWDRYRRWVDAIGDYGVVYLPLGYSGMGHLLNAWMGIERTMYAVHDWPETTREVVDQINENNLDLVDLAATSSAEVVLLGDNFSSNVQPPRFFEKWSRPYYLEAVRRLHAAGKHVAVHVDGKLKGALDMIRDTGADCADAVTPAPMGDLNPAECRNEAGDDFILSGGISPDLLLPSANDTTWREAAIRWLDLRRRNSRLLIGVGDELPIGVSDGRIAMLRDFIEEHGRYD